MTVEEILGIIPLGVEVRILQPLIRAIDPIKVPVLRQFGEVHTLINSNQNYLKFKAGKLYQDNGILTILCIPDINQEADIIAAYYSMGE